MAAYFTRGTGHNEEAIYSERPEDYVQNTARLRRKHNTARTLVPQPVVDAAANAQIGPVAFGSVDPAIVEARDILRDQHGIETSYLRVRGLPLSPAVSEFVSRYERVYVVENNVEGQLAQIMLLDMPQHGTKITSLAHLDGLPLTAVWVVDNLLEQEEQANG